jgi:hypothetical protein
MGLGMLPRGGLDGAFILEMAFGLNLGNSAKIFRASLQTIDSLKT